MLPPNIDQPQHVLAVFCKYSIAELMTGSSGLASPSPLDL